MTMRQRVLIGLIVTVFVAFLLGFTASRGVLGSHGWAVALIVGAAFCAVVAVALWFSRYWPANARLVPVAACSAALFFAS